MFILDTDTLTHLQHRHAGLLRRLAELDVTDITATTIISYIEILRGRFDALLKAANAVELVQAQQRLAQSQQFLVEMTVLPINNANAAQFVTLNADRRVRRIGRADLLIAAIALAHRATLVTRNTRNFQLVPGLDVVNWVDE